MASFLDAAYHILLESSRPMSYEEITELALEQELISTQGATPERTMAAKLYMDIKQRGSGSRFIQIAPNRFSVRSLHPGGYSHVAQSAGEAGLPMERQAMECKSRGCD